MPYPQSRSFFAAIVAVLSALIGIRKRGASFADECIKPLHIIVAGLLCVVTFVGVLLMIVRLVITNAK
jgi:hypothetical protein